MKNDKIKKNMHLYITTLVYIYHRTERGVCVVWFVKKRNIYIFYTLSYSLDYSIINLRINFIRIRILF